MSSLNVHDVTTMIYPYRIFAFVDKNCQILTYFSSVLFNTQVKELKNGGHLYTLRNFMLFSIINNNEALKGVTREAEIITVALIQAENKFCIIPDTLK